MKRLIIVLVVLLLCSCQANVIRSIPSKVPTIDIELGIKRAAVFLLIMRGDKWGEKELVAEIEYLKYLISQK